MTALASTVERDALRTGVGDMLPGAIGVFPFAVMIGVAISESDVVPIVGFVGGILTSGGSAHLAVVGSLGAAAGALVAITTALLIQMRGLAYSAALASTIHRQPRWFRWVASYMLVDQVFALAIAVSDRPTNWFRRYYLAAGCLIYGAYMSGVLVGLVAGPVIPQGSVATLAIPLMFVALLAPSLTSAPSVAAASTAGTVVALLSGVAAHGVVLIVAMVLGAVTGALTERVVT